MVKQKYRVRIESVSATETFSDLLDALNFIEGYVTECVNDNGDGLGRTEPGIITIDTI